MQKTQNATPPPSNPSLHLLKSPSSFGRLMLLATLSGSAVGGGYLYTRHSLNGAGPAPAKRPVGGDLAQSLLFELKLLDSCLTSLRSQEVWSRHPKREPEAYFDKELPPTIGNIRSILREGARQSTVILTTAEQEALTDLLVKIEALHEVGKGPKELAPEELHRLNNSRAVLKVLFRSLADRIERQNTDPNFAEQKNQGGAGRGAPHIISVAEGIPTGSRELNGDIGTLLRQLWLVSSEGRKRLTVGMIEDSSTKVLRLYEAQEPGFEEPVMHVFVSKQVDVRGDIRQAVLHFCQTIKIHGGVATGLGFSTSGGVTVQNTLVEEVPVNEDFSISAYNTCLSYSSNSAGTKAEVSFSNESELTFYGKNSHGILDFAFRSIVRGVTNHTLVRSKEDTLGRAQKLMNGIIESGESSLTHITLPDPNR